MIQLKYCSFGMKQQYKQGLLNSLLNKLFFIIFFKTSEKLNLCCSHKKLNKCFTSTHGGVGALSFTHVRTSIPL